jgi:hypothetical protein
MADYEHLKTEINHLANNLAPHHFTPLSKGIGLWDKPQVAAAVSAPAPIAFNPVVTPSPAVAKPQPPFPQQNQPRSELKNSQPHPCKALGPK